MGHGNHWGAVLKDVPEGLGRVLDIGVTRGDVIGRRRYPSWRGAKGTGKADVTLIENAKSGFGSLGIVVADNSSRNYLHSAFPVGSRGQTQSINVLGVSESSFGLEACITARLGDAKITFFEPYYALNAGAYQTEADLDVTLSAVAYHVEVPDPNETVVHPEIGKVHLQGAAMLLPMNRSDSGIASTDGFGLSYILAEHEEPGPGDYQFRGVVKEAEGVEFLGLPAWRFTTTMLRLNEGDTDVDLDLYVLDENIRDGHRPAIGGDIVGTLWLQGFVRPS